MAIAWISDWNIGIDIIDSQHKRIVEYINQLEKAIRQGNRHATEQILDEVVDYTLSHFAFEESLLEEAQYVYAKPHKAVHDVFVKRVAKYQARHDAGENIAAELHRMLSTWLVHHIERDDKAYVLAVKKSRIIGTVQDKKGNDWLDRSLTRFFK